MVTFQEIIEEPKLDHSDTLPKIEQLLSSSLDSELESRQAHDNDDLESSFRPEGSSSKAKQKAKFKHSRHRRSLLNAGKKVILTEEERAEFDCITFETIQSITDVNKLFRLEQYMIQEGFSHTGAAARDRLVELGELPTQEEEEELRTIEEKEERQIKEELMQWQQSMSSFEGETVSSFSGNSVQSDINAPKIRKFETSKQNPEAQTENGSRADNMVSTSTKKKGDIRSGAEYYKEWDKIAGDLDKESNSSETSNKCNINDKTSIPLSGNGKRSSRTSDDDWARSQITGVSNSVSEREKRWHSDREKEKGNEFFRARDFDSAIDAYSIAIALDSTNPYVFSNRSNAYMKVKRYDDAERDCTSSLKLLPRNVKALFRRASSRLELEKYQEAFDDACLALEIDGDNKEVLSIHKKAFQKLEHSKAQSGAKPKEPSKRILIEEVNDEEHNHDDHSDERKSEAEFVPAATFEGRKEGFVFKKDSLGVGYYQDRDTSKDCNGADADSLPTNACLTSTNIEEKKDKKSSEQEAIAKKASGDLNFRQAKYEEAIADYSQAITVGTSDIDTSNCVDKDLLKTLYNNRATCYMKCSSYELAEEDSTMAIDLDVNYGKAYHRRASARKCLGKLDEALVDYKFAQKFYLNNTALQLEIDTLEEEIQDRDNCPSPRTCGTSTAACEIGNPKSELYETSKEAGKQLFIQGRYDDAIVKYTECLSIDPEDAIILSNRALCWLRMGNFDEAQKDADKAIVSDPRCFKAYHRRGAARRSLGKMKEALDDYAKALEGMPNDINLIREHRSMKAETADDSIPKDASSYSSQTNVDNLRVEGNQCYRAADYAGAVACYEKSLQFGENAVVYSNISQCKLKMGDYMSAELASSRAIQLDPKLMKAFYRRFCARRFLKKYNEAIEDMKIVLKHQRSKELEKEYEDILREFELVKSAPRERLVIEEEDSDDDNYNNDVDDDDDDDGSEDKGRRCHVKEMTNENLASKENCPSNDSKNNTIIEATSEKSSESNVPAPICILKSRTIGSTTAPAVKYVRPKLNVPISNMDFEKDIRSLEGDKDGEALYLQNIDPASFPSIFKIDLSQESVSTIVRIIGASVLNSKPELALDILEGLSKVKRFSVIVMLLPRQTKADIKRIFLGLETSIKQSSNRIEVLKGIYKSA